MNKRFTRIISTQFQEKEKKKYRTESGIENLTNTQVAINEVNKAMTKSNICKHMKKISWLQDKQNRRTNKPKNRNIESRVVWNTQK